jgi:hypothetical protein
VCSAEARKKSPLLDEEERSSNYVNEYARHGINGPAELGTGIVK